MNIDENDTAKDRQLRFTVSAGPFSGWSKIRKEVTITQTGKGATYLKAVPDSVELIESDDNGASAIVRVETDGDKWEVVTCPDWVWSKTDGNKLELAAKQETDQDREGFLLLKSYGEITNIRVSQKGKPRPSPMPVPKSVPPAPKPNQRENVLPMYRELKFNVADAVSFSRILIVDKEVDGATAFSLMKKYQKEGWRILVRSEFLFLAKSHLDLIPFAEYGYWIGCDDADLQSVSVCEKGSADPTPNESRILFVK